MTLSTPTPVPEITTSAPLPSLAYTALVQLALAEDLGRGDCTVSALWPNAQASPRVSANIVARAPLVVSGLGFAQIVFQQLDTTLSVTAQVTEGRHVPAGTVLLKLEGPAATILMGERTALNALQHLCGIATTTRKFVDAIAHTPCKLLDTRKTTPGWRVLEKQAVRHGGGHNHRMDLGAGAMLKDNHWVAAQGSITTAIQQLRAALSPMQRLELEVDSLAQLAEILPTHPDMVLLDNFTVAELKDAVAMVRAWEGPKPLLEASGGITHETVTAIAETGVNFLSTSQITLGAPAVDIGLDFEASLKTTL